MFIVFMREWDYGMIVSQSELVFASLQEAKDFITQVHSYEEVLFNNEWVGHGISAWII